MEHTRFGWSRRSSQRAQGGQDKTPPGAETGLDAKHNIYVPSEGMGELFS